MLEDFVHLVGFVSELFFLSLKAVFLLDIWTRYIGPIDCVLMPNIPSKMKPFELKELMEN